MTTFIELLMTMMATQKMNRSGWMDPSDSWGQKDGLQGLKDKIREGNG